MLSFGNQAALFHLQDGCVEFLAITQHSNTNRSSESEGFSDLSL